MHPGIAQCLIHVSINFMSILKFYYPMYTENVLMICFNSEFESIYTLRIGILDPRSE